MAEIYLAKISSLVERFCEQIGDEHMVLADNIIQSRHKAVMLMLVEKSDTDDIAVLAFSYNLRKRSITEIKTFDRQNCEAIEKFVSAKLIGNFMDKITDVCDSSKCEYLFENGNIYYIGEEGMVKSWVANINGFNVDKVAEIFNKAEEQGEKPFKKDIGGSDYLLIPKDVVDKILGRDKDRVCASPLSGLASLKELDMTYLCLEEKGLADISPLYSLSGLEALYMNGCSIADTDFLKNMSGMTSLKALYIDSIKVGGTDSFENSLKDISGIEQLTSLEELSLSGRIEDISPLGSLTNMKSLLLSNGYIESIENLHGMMQMEELTLLCKNVSDISPMKNMTQIKTLYISSDNLSDISAVSGMTQIEKLDLHNCKNLSDISPLSGLSSLKELNFNYCESLSELSPIAELKGLESLDIMHIAVDESCTDIFLGLESLQHISVSEDCVSDSDLSRLREKLGDGLYIAS